MRTQAAVLRDPTQSFHIEDIELKALGPDEILVEIAGVGLCQTDLIARQPGFTGGEPIVLGHEGAGVVVQVGAAVRSIEPGDHVILSYESCGRCEVCRSGADETCIRVLEVNVDIARGDVSASDASGSPVSARWFGQSSFARHAIASERNAIVVDRDVPLATLAPLGCSILTGYFSMVRALAVRPGSRVAVLGVGAVGMSAVLGAVDAGAAVVVAVDRHDGRLARVSELGATDTVSGAEDLAGALRTICPEGFDVILDTTGIPAVIGTGLRALRPGGVLGLVAVQHGPLVIEPGDLDGRTIRHVLGGGVSPRRGVPLLVQRWRDGALPMERIVTTFPLIDIDRAEAAARTGAAIKPVLIP